MTDVFVGRPFAQVEFATETGGLTIYQEQQLNINNLDFDILNITTNRDVGGNDCPTFQITLVYKEDWYQRIGGNDFIKITLGRGSKGEPVFFGMVDDVYKSTSYVDLKPVRTINISGRGFNKALIQFGIGAVQEVNATFGTMNFFEGQDAGFTRGGPAEVVKTVMDYYVEKGIDISFANGKRWKDYIDCIYLKNADGSEDESLSNVSNYYTYQGGLWDYLKELRNAPFYEIFWEILNEKPTMIVRPTPFNPNDWTELPMIQVDEREIIEENCGRSDLETYTVFAVKGDSLIAGDTAIFGSPLWYKPFYAKYGLRRLEVISKYMKFSDAELLRNNTETNETQGTGGGYTGFSEGGSNGSLGFPTDNNARFTSGFGMRIHPTKKTKSMHTGVDLAIREGTPVYSVDDGTVSTVGFNNISGHYIMVQHPSGLVTRYQHLHEKPPYRNGDSVTRGQQIGVVGSTGRSTGPHLHFEVHVNGKPVDPAPYIGLSKKNKGKKGGGGMKYTPLRSIEWDINKGTEGKLADKRKMGFEIFDNIIRKDHIGKKEVKKFQTEKLMESIGAFDPTMALGDKLGSAFKTQRDQSFYEKANAEIEQEIEQSYQDGNNDPGDLSGITTQKTIDLFNWNIKNNMMENGSISLRGNAIYKVGSRLYIPSSDMEYYIENVSHRFVYNQNWVTNLEVTRGLKLGTRFSTPWNEWEVITADDLMEISGVDPSTALVSSDMVAGNQGSTGNSKISHESIPGFRERIQKAAYRHESDVYNQGKRMENGFSDCSSLVYKVAMEAHGLSWKGTWAPNTKSFRSDLWYEIPLEEAKPWDIVWRHGHVEFIGDNGMTFGAHKVGVPTGSRSKYNPKQWTKAYRIKGA